MCATPERWISEQHEVQSVPEYKDYLIDIVSADDGLLYYTAKRTRYLLLVVPRAFRRYITMKAHVALYHLTEKYTRLKLLDTYWWPSLSRDVKLFLSECSECDDVRSQQFAAHARVHTRDAQNCRVKSKLFVPRGHAHGSPTHSHIGLCVCTARLCANTGMPRFGAAGEIESGSGDLIINVL